MEDQQQRYERARARVQAIKGFYILPASSW